MTPFLRFCKCINAIGQESFESSIYALFIGGFPLFSSEVPKVDGSGEKNDIFV